MASPALTAVYTSPASASDSSISSTPLPELSSTPSTDDRVAFLAALQNAVKTGQDDVNTFLTKKMEEDKAAVGKQELEDEKLEENYGEEGMGE